MSSADAVIAAIVVARLVLPLGIPRFPLLIIAALILDAVDNSLLAAFTDVDLGPDGPYQSFDKALDIYYLSIAYLSTLRNWSSTAAVRIAMALFYYRLVGVLLFELTHERALLLIFPNTFEYFFIAYEVVRLRFDPLRIGTRGWLATAAGIWVFIKLPQEYWIHVAQLDFTDAVADHPWFGVACAVGLLAIAGFCLFWVRPRLPPPDWNWRFAAEPLSAPARAERVRWGEVAEKIALLGLLSVIFASILPSVQIPALGVVFGVAVVVAANTAISLMIERELEFGVLLVINLAFVYLGSRFFSENEHFPLGTGLFFALLFTVLLSMYDAYKPVHDARAAA